MEAASTDNKALMAFEGFEPVFLFGPDVVEAQSAAGRKIQSSFQICIFVKFTFIVMCSGSANFFPMGVNYTASWRARDDKVEFTLVANSSRQWLAIGFTDKQRMVGIVVQCHIYVALLWICSLEI